MKLLNFTSNSNISSVSIHRTSSLAGNQPKERRGNTYYKYDFGGIKSGLIEHLVSVALNYVTFNGKPIDHVKYISIPNGCKCEEYKMESEQEITLDAFLNDFTLDELNQFEFSELIAKYFICDALFYNEDRHFGNLPVLYTRHSKRLAPLFDFGNALSFYGEVDYTKYKPEPYGIMQVKWALNKLQGIPIKFMLTQFEITANKLVVSYDDVQKNYILKKIHRCATSSFIQNFIEVV